MTATNLRALALVGRGWELDQLLEWADESRHGSPRCVLVRGEAGIGKSRLLEEAAHRLRPQFETLAGRCHEDLAVPYLPIANALDALVSDWSASSAGGEFDVGRSDDRLTLFLRVTAALREACATRPVALIIDDAQWIDPASADLVAHIVATAVVDGARERASLFVVLAHRPFVASTPASRMVDRVQRESLARELPVGPFGPAEVHALVTAVAGAPPSRPLLHDLMTSSNGNPLMVVWLLQRLEDFGALKSSRGVLVNAASSDIVGLPTGLDDLLRERTSSVSPRCRTLLVTAALIGDDEPLADLEAVVGAPPDGFRRLLDEAVDAGLLEEVGTRYQFSHPQVRQLHYHTPRGQRRRELHRRIADRLEAVHAHDTAYSLPIAHHLRKTGDRGEHERLARYGVSAAARAASMGAWNEAWQLYEAVLDATEHDTIFPSAFRAAVHHRAAVAAWWSLDNRAARDHAQQAVAHARALGDLERWGQAALVEARAVRTVEPIGAQLDTEPLTAFLDEAGDARPDLRAGVHASLALTLINSNRSELAPSHMTAAWDLARDAGDPHLLRDVELSLAGVHLNALELDLALALYSDAVERDPLAEAPILHVWASVRLGLVRLLRDELDPADEQLQRAETVARDLGAYGEQAYASAYRVAVAAAARDRDRAERLAVDALLLARLGDAPLAARAANEALAAARSDDGDVGGALAALDDIGSLGGVRRLRALVEARAGHAAAASPNPTRPDGPETITFYTLGRAAADLALACATPPRTVDERLRRAVDQLCHRGVRRAPGWPFDLRELVETG